MPNSGRFQTQPELLSFSVLKACFIQLLREAASTDVNELCLENCKIFLVCHSIFWSESINIFRRDLAIMQRCYHKHRRVCFINFFVASSRPV